MARLTAAERKSLPSSTFAGPGRSSIDWDVSERFFAKIDFTGDCWHWTGAAHDGYPYGAFWDGRKLVRAHRWSYEHFKGLIPDGYYVLHKCDNPRCVRPIHLFVGTQADNIHDAMQKGRKTPPPIGVRSKESYHRKVTCKYGHQRWKVRPDGVQTCLECHRIREAKRRHGKTHSSRT